ncbi:MAG TPA: M20 family peptidase [Thermoanaerobaculia bacterium]|jgi:carboxypeptidase PM20D1|nr:M20 family peptidase [Thermoanaerobaculia bacterium]
MKKALAVLVLVLLILVAILTARAAAVKSRQVEAAPVTDLAIDARAAAERLAGAIRFPTVSHEDGKTVEAEAFRGLHSHLAQSFPRVHAVLTRETVADYSLLYTWKGRNPNLAPILLMSHLDVVPIEPGTERDWTQPPFSGLIDGVYVWGRGTMDDKVSVLAILEAAETLLARDFQPQRTLYFAFGHDEEVGGSKGAAAIGALLERRGVRPELILDEGGAIVEGIVPGVARPVAFVGTAEKGSVTVELVVADAGGHSSMPPPHSAVGKLAAAIKKLEDNPMPARIDGATKHSFEYLAPEMPFGPRLVLANLWLFAPLAERQFASEPAGNASIRTTAAATIFQAGIKENVLPHRARAVLNFRILPGDTIASVLRYVRETVGPDIHVASGRASLREPSPESDAEAPGFRLIQRTLAQTLPGTVVAPNLLSGGTDSRHYLRLSRNVYRFLPIRMKREDLGRFHGTDERVSLESYAEVVRFYAQLLRNGAG